MKYKYQMHMHTYPCSKCARMNFEQLLEALSAGGYSGGVITNHFLSGNTGIDRGLKWEAFVREYEKDFEYGKKIAKNYGLNILFGLEENVGQAKEILCYGITPEFLYQHPELRKGGLQRWSMLIHQEGGICVQAHPFRHRDYIRCPGLLDIQYLDGIEVYNFNNDFADNMSAEQFAAENPNMIFVSGADAHTPEQVCCAGIETEKAIFNEKQLAQVLKQGSYRMIFEKEK